jgi:outer membrane protein assembly factor BamB
MLRSQDIPAMLGMNILTPSMRGDTIFTSAYGGGSQLLEIKRQANGFQATTAWKTAWQRYMSTPVVIDRYAYLHLRNQRFTCVDLTTGDKKWTTEPYGQYWSLVAQGDRIVALDQRGELLLICATPEKFDLPDSRKIREQETWGRLAVCGEQVFVRELNGVSAYHWK